MRASRLLQILLLLQNRGRMTAGRLAAELEVTRRTILRDVDALTEAGLPILVFAGHGGGIELGFNYRTRLTGLAEDEAEAIGIWLTLPPSPMIEALGITLPLSRARAKMVESLPDRVRHIANAAALRFRQVALPTPAPDPRISALAAAIRDARIVRLAARSPSPRTVHPVRLTASPGGWLLRCALTGADIPDLAWGDINISARRFAG